MRHRLIWCITSISLAATSPANAQSFTCPGKPATYLGVSGDSDVFVWVDNVGVVKICSLAAAVGGVSVQACQAWYASLLTQKISEQTAVLFFDPATVGGKTACNQLVPWTANYPYFIGQ